MSSTRTGFDLLGSDSKLQEHWLRRFAALIVDGIIVGLAIWVVILLPVSLLFLAAGPFVFFTGIYLWFLFPFVAGLLYTAYGAIMESSYGHTIGKQLLGIRVATVSGGRITITQGFLRNISKVFWLLLLLDVIIGLATVGDPRQKYTDRMAGVVVISTHAPTVMPPAPPPPPP